MTGEMGWIDIEEGGEHYGWAQELRRAAQQIARKSRWAVKFMEVRPFDEYQGPYAVMSDGKLWSGEDDGEFYWEHGLHDDRNKEGTIDEIAAYLRSVKKGE